MNEQEFGRHLRSQLNTYPSPVNTEALWLQVEARLPKKRKRRGIILFFCFSVLLLAAMWYFSASTSHLIVPTPVTASTSINEATPRPEQQPSPRESSAWVAQTDETGKLSETTKLNAAAFLKPTSPLKDSSTQVPFHEEVVNYENTLLPNDNSDSTERLEMLRTLGNFSFTSPLDFTWNDSLPQNMEEVKKKSTSERSGIILRSDFGGGLVRRELESNNPVWIDYTQQREETEMPLEFIRAQSLIGYQFSSGYYALTGLSVTRINERFHIDRNLQEIEVIPVVTGIYINPDGDSVFTHGTHEILHIHHQQMTHYNQYTMLEVPFVAGYSWRINRWLFSLEAGAFLNLSLRTKGNILGFDNEITRLEDSQLFKERLQWSYMGSANVGYALTETLHIHFAPGVQLLRGSMLAHDSQHQQYQLFGVQAGITYRMAR